MINPGVNTTNGWQGSGWLIGDGSNIFDNTWHHIVLTWDGSIQRFYLDGIEQGIKLTKAAGIRPRGYFIIGNPGENKETVQETIDFVKRVPFAEVQMSFMCPFPGTDLNENATEYGEFDNDWSKLNIWTPVFIPHGWTREMLEAESKRFYRQFYFRPGPILRYGARALRQGNLSKYIKFLLSVRGAKGQFHRSYRIEDGKGIEAPSPYSDARQFLL